MDLSSLEDVQVHWNKLPKVNIIKDLSGKTYLENQEIKGPINNLKINSNSNLIVS